MPGRLANSGRKHNREWLESTPNSRHVSLRQARRDHASKHLAHVISGILLLQFEREVVGFFLGGTPLSGWRSRIWKRLVLRTRGRDWTNWCERLCCGLRG